MKYVNNFVSSERQSFSSSVQSFLSPYVDIPFCQSEDGELECNVKVGDFVSEGQIIAKQKDKNLTLHSSIPGKVDKIEKCTLASGKLGFACNIKLQGEFSFFAKKTQNFEYQNYSSSEITNKFASLGVINTFKNPISLANQIESSKLKNNKFVVLRMFDEDPSRMTDLFVAENYTKEVLEGLKIVAKAFEAKAVILLASQKSKFDFDFDKEFADLPSLFIKVDTSKYPCGFAENLINLVKETLKNKNSSSKFSKFAKISPENSQIDFSKINRECIFIDSETAFSARNAIVFNKPVVENFVHFTGNCLRAAAMFKVRIGTPVKSLIKQCGGFKTKCAKIVINGLITGKSVYTYDFPISKDIKSIEFLPSVELFNQNTSPCIRCGKCRRICPENLFPDLIYENLTEDFEISASMKQTVNLCSECNLCNSICPSRLPLSQSILLLKNQISENQMQNQNFENQNQN